MQRFALAARLAVRARPALRAPALARPWHRALCSSTNGGGNGEDEEVDVEVEVVEKRRGAAAAGQVTMLIGPVGWWY